MSSLTFCHPVILQFLFASIFFVTDCKELELSQSALTDQFFNFLNLIGKKGLSDKMWTQQSRQVIWDMINTLFLTTVAVEPTFVAFL